MIDLNVYEFQTNTQEEEKSLIGGREKAAKTKRRNEHNGKMTHNSNVLSLSLSPSLLYIFNW
jgi:hypothetical protein